MMNEEKERLDEVHIVLVAHFEEDDPYDILGVFSSKEKAEQFVRIQKGIYFPYPSYEIQPHDVF